MKYVYSAQTQQHKLDPVTLCEKDQFWLREIMFYKQSEMAEHANGLVVEPSIPGAATLICESQRGSKTCSLRGLALSDRWLILRILHFYCQIFLLHSHSGLR